MLSRRFTSPSGTNRSRYRRRTKRSRIVAERARRRRLKTCWPGARNGRYRSRCPSVGGHETLRPDKWCPVKVKMVMRDNQDEKIVSLLAE